MEINQEDLNKLLELRKSLVLEFESFQAYKSDKNAIMKEIDHVYFVGRTIKRIDEFLSKYVQFG
tara:strand:- start:2804 stop:2995 length:192 start_codon:yes stop_codon:yes gene_type:complete